MTEDASVTLAIDALANVRNRMQFADCWEEGVRNVAAAIKAAAESAEVNALSFKLATDDAAVIFVPMF